jgi:hypothetical protein
MLFDGVFKNPLFKKAMATGEEQAGRAFAKLLSSERLTSGLTSLASAASAARATFEAGVQSALKAANLPSAGEMESLKHKLSELESLIDDLSTKVDAEPKASGPVETPAEKDHRG